MSDTYRDARDALREFESRLKLARDALDVAIDRAIPIDFFLANDAYGAEDAPGNTDILHVVKDVEAHRGSLHEAEEIIGGAFDEFDWEVDRALRDLRRALTQFAEETP